jgi:UDP-2,3-diacylglucosamine pyrophosphatase LpxH
MSETGAFARWWRAVRDAVRAGFGRDKAKMVAFGLTAAYERAGDPERFDLQTGRLAIFSDHHRGAGAWNGADDFKRCERAYRSALAHYLERGHRLALLGDVEELWENSVPKPLDAYPEVLELERAFYEDGRLWRFYGNHDLVWSSPKMVRRFLRERVGAELEVRESLKLDVYDGDRKRGRIYLAHGHQGTLDSDVFAPLARLPVHYIWPRLQNSVHFASTSPAIDFALRERHDRAMFAWACDVAPEPLVLIAGHTHKPVFRSRRPAGEFPSGKHLPTVEEARRALEQAPPDERPERHAMLQYVSTPPYGGGIAEFDPPCYFNTGCCSFGDGDVTLIEIADGEIRLIRWLDNEDEPAPRVLDHGALADVLDEVSALRSSAPGPVAA